MHGRFTCRAGSPPRALVLVLLLVPATRALGEPNRHRALVLEPVPDGVGQRLGGQLADLPWSIEHQNKGTPTVHLALQQPYDVVIWLTETVSGLETVVVDVNHRRALTRRFDTAPDEPLAASAVRETAALFVRGVLEAIAGGATIGVAYPAEALAAQAPRAPPRPPPTEPPTARNAAFALTVLGGGALAFDGNGTPVSVLTAVSAHFEPLYLGFRAAVGLPARIEQLETVVTLARHELLLRAGAGWSGGIWGLEGGGVAGALLYRRATEETPADLQPTGAALTVALALGAEFGVTLWFHEAIGVVASGAVFGVIGAPELAVDRGDRRIELRETSPIQGVVTLALRARIVP